MVKKRVSKTETKSDKQPKKIKNFNFKDMVMKSFRVLIAVFVMFVIVGTLVQAVPFTIVFVGGLIGISAQVMLNSADFYVWVLTSLFVVALYVYFTIKVVTYLWYTITGFRRN